jgi:invasion protein IalB
VRFRPIMNPRGVAGRVAVAMLLFLYAAYSADAQVQERSKTNPAAPAALTAVAPSQWVVACANTQAGLNCRVGQSVLFKQANRNIQVSVSLQRPPDTKKPNLVLQLPLGIYLPSGVTLRFGGAGAKVLSFQTCNPNGCVAEHAISQAEIASLVKGADLTLAVRALNKTSFSFKIPAEGFAAAYAKMKSK